MATTNETKWSEAPWTVDGAAGRTIQANHDGRGSIAEAYATGAMTYEEMRANAALISAAPDLYDAVRLAFDLAHAGHPALESVCDHVECRQFHAALAKARGEVR
jgi:hypothetical protein